LCCRQGGWLADFAELGEKARGQLLQATSSTSLAATQVLASFSSTSSSSALGGAAAAAASGGSGSSSMPGGLGSAAAAAANPAGFGSVAQGSKLSFSFELTAAELVPALTAGPAAAGAAAAAAGGGLTSGGGAGSGGGAAAAAAAGVLSVGPGKESLTYAGLLKRGLGDFAGGSYLTPAVFLAVSNFVSDALIVISDAALLALPPSPSSSQQQQQQQKPAAAAAGFSAGSGFGVQHQQAEAQQGLVLSDPRLNSMWLRQSVEEFVVDGFLPQVWVDLRGRCVFFPFYRRLCNTCGAHYLLFNITASGTRRRSSASSYETLLTCRVPVLLSDIASAGAQQHLKTQKHTDRSIHQSQQMQHTSCFVLILDLLLFCSAVT
jgi:hypothetical protein